MCIRCTCNNHLSKETKKETRSKFIEIDQQLNQNYTGRSIKDQRDKFLGSMTDKIEWWKGLGEELQVDIETTIDDN